MGNSQSPPASDPRFALATRAFTKQELDDLRAVFVSLAAQSQSNSRFISPSVFQAYYGLKGALSDRLFDLVTRRRGDGTLLFEDLVTAKAVYEKGTRQEIEEFLYQLCDVSGDGLLTRSDLEAVLKSVQEMIFSSPKNMNPELCLNQNQDFIRTFINAASFSNENALSAADFRSWCNALPCVRKFLVGLLQMSGENQIPRLHYPKDLRRDVVLMRREYAWLIGGLLPEEELEEWRLLYHSSLNGQSFNTFLGSVADAGGPTILVIRDREGYIYGGYGSQPWEKHSTFYGDMKSFLFQLFPKASTFRPTGTNANLQWCAVNFSSESIPNGVGFGGRLNHFGLFISSSFDQGHTFPCSTFDSPSLSKSTLIQPDVIECWAVANGETSESAVKGSILERFKEDRNMLKLVGLASSSDTASRSTSATICANGALRRLHLLENPRKITHTESSKHLNGFLVDRNLFRLNGGHLGHEIHPPIALLSRAELRLCYQL